MLIAENIDESRAPSREELPARMREKAGDYALLRRVTSARDQQDGIEVPDNLRPESGH